MSRAYLIVDGGIALCRRAGNTLLPRTGETTRERLRFALSRRTRERAPSAASRDCAPSVPAGGRRSPLARAAAKCKAEPLPRRLAGSWEQRVAGPAAEGDPTVDYEISPRHGM